MQSKEFTNEQRTRYYGLRVGDIVDASYPSSEEWVGEVVGFNLLDNNSVKVRFDDCTRWIVAEYCKLITKIEDRIIP